LDPRGGKRRSAPLHSDVYPACGLPYSRSSGSHDLDAPDLLSPAIPETESNGLIKNQIDRLNGDRGQAAQQKTQLVTTKKRAHLPLTPLEPEASAALRELRPKRAKSHWVVRAQARMPRLSPVGWCVRVDAVALRCAASMRGLRIRKATQRRFSNGVARMSKEPGRFFPRPPTVCTLAKQHTLLCHLFPLVQSFCRKVLLFCSSLSGKGRASAGCTPDAASISLVVRPGKALWPCRSSGEKLRLYLRVVRILGSYAVEDGIVKVRTPQREKATQLGAPMRFG
jgi:hypothetical protein